MKTKFFFIALMVFLSVAGISSSLSGCSAGAHIGPVGAGARVG